MFLSCFGFYLTLQILISKPTVSHFISQHNFAQSIKRSIKRHNGLWISNDGILFVYQLVLLKEPQVTHSI